MDKGNLRRTILFPIITALIYLPLHGKVKKIINDNIEYFSSKSQLETLADTNKSGPPLSFSEQAKMYEACGVADNSSTYILTIKEMEKGIANYRNLK